TQSRREWMTRRHIALKEKRESQFWLRQLRDAKPSRTSPPLDRLVDESGQLVAILTTVLNTARRRDNLPRPG
ncbi:MAG: hypothetical protein AB7Q16_17410, partial [Vicinamibacterales bacterium]